jgi:hypothetical protein
MINIQLAKSIFVPVALCIVLNGCTTMVAYTSLEPYTTDKGKRNALEVAAEQYCQAKKEQSACLNYSRPDYIFTTDGCTRWFDGSWTACCVAHDIAYWCGGTSDNREEADQLLMQCANQKQAFLGYLMYASVRVMGSPWLPTPWRWGYGWKQWPLGYEKSVITEPEAEILKQLLIPALLENDLDNGGITRK